MHFQFGSKWTFLTTLEATLDVLSQCDHPHVGLAFDIYQLWRERDLCDRIPGFAHWLRNVEVSDWREPPRSEYDRCLPGRGTIPLSDVLCAIRDAGYDGYYNIQIHSEEYWNADYVALLHDCQVAFQSLWQSSSYHSSPNGSPGAPQDGF
jgi:sugar phosphate isomerase/epimerase